MIPAEFMVGKMISKNNFVNRMGPHPIPPDRMGSVYFGPPIALYFRNLNRMGLSRNPLIRELIDYNKL